MLEKLQELQEEALQALDSVTDLEALDSWRITHLGRRGTLTQVLRGVGRLPPEERPAVGQRGNEIKTVLQEAYDRALDRLKGEAMRQALEAERVDVTLPGHRPSLGRLHLSTRILHEIYDIFARMGFQVEESPEVELDLFNFELLNIPKHHPARDMQDTFYIDEERLLRTHTSPGQIRTMRQYCPEPIRVILPGKCYRYEQITARSEIQFHQVEGLAVGRHVTMADLKGVFTEFARMMFGEERRVRFRCSHFPFTEPSAEVDIDCILCDGEGCRVCKYTGWLEISGAGMVHPTVLQNGGYDPEVYSGYAFGMGPERIAMLKYRIDDIRTFFTSDLRFLEQF